MTPLKLKAWRQKNRLTQEQAATDLGVSVSQYKRWENGSWEIPLAVSKYIGALNAIENMEFECPHCKGAVCLKRDEAGDFAVTPI